MTTRVIDLDVAFDAQPVIDGRPPARVAFIYRPCWRKPAVRLELVLAYIEGPVAYYARAA